MAYPPTLALNCIGKLSMIVLSVVVSSHVFHLKPVQCKSFVGQVQENYRQPDRLQFCGSQLAGAIKTFCDRHAAVNGLYTGGPSPRAPTVLPLSTQRHHRTQHGLHYGSKSPPERSRVPRSVSDECCVKPCNTSQLLKYCRIRDYEEYSDEEELTTALPSMFSDENWVMDDEPAFSFNDIPFFPMLIELLWGTKTTKDQDIINSPGKARTYRRFTPTNDQHQKINPPSYQARIITRDTHQVRHSPPANINTHQFRHRAPASDETPRDIYSSEELPTTPSPTSTPIRFRYKEPLRSQAVQIVDDLPFSFPVPSNTNDDWRIY